MEMLVIAQAWIDHHHMQQLGMHHEQVLGRDWPAGESPEVERDMQGAAYRRREICGQSHRHRRLDGHDRDEGGVGRVAELDQVATRHLEIHMGEIGARGEAAHRDEQSHRSERDERDLAPGPGQERGVRRPAQVS